MDGANNPAVYMGIQGDDEPTRKAARASAVVYKKVLKTVH